MTHVKPPRHCRFPSCGRLVSPPVVYCAKHQPVIDRQRAKTKYHNDSRPPAHQQGYDWDWRQLRDTLKSQPAYMLCAVCQDATTHSLHHIKPVASHPDLRLVISNLMPVCGRCHSMLEGRIRDSNKTEGSLDKYLRWLSDRDLIDDRHGWTGMPSQS